MELADPAKVANYPFEREARSGVMRWASEDDESVESSTFMKADYINGLG